MAKYQCNKGHVFTHPAKQIDQSSFLLAVGEGKEEKVIGATGSYPKLIVETYVCPKCMSITFSEYVEPTTNVENVYIYELTTGPQTALDGLLAQGYAITNRYAKAYHLEKPKAVESPQQAEDKFTQQVQEAYLKLHPGETPQ